jgi:hypothetical protein
LDVIGEPINNVGSLDNANWTVYPNPANDVLTIEKTSPDAVVDVYNASGQALPVLANQTTNRVTIETSSWTNGLYFIVHRDAQGSSTRRVVVQH